MQQSDFTAAILDPAAAVPPGMVDPEGRPAGKRFNVYRNNLAASLSEALETGFPVLHRLLGAQSFQTLALIFSRAHPPTSRALSQYGDALPEFLEGFQALAAYPYLADIARLVIEQTESAVAILPSARQNPIQHRHFDIKKNQINFFVV